MPEQPSITRINLETDTENIRFLQDHMEREKGIRTLKGCILAAIDYWVQAHRNNTKDAPSQENSAPEAGNVGQGRKNTGL